MPHCLKRKIAIYFFLVMIGLTAVSIPWPAAQDLDDSFSSSSPSAEQGVEPGLFEKKMAEIPESETKQFIDAGDFRDPFFLLRGYREDSSKALEPGTTIDGVRFFSYSDINKSIDKFYRDSNFSQDNVFGRVVFQRKGERCLTCHFGIEEISENHRFACTQCHEGNGKAFSYRSAHRGLVTNPSDLKHASEYCGKCHADQVEKVSRSLMATAKGEINLTRYTWGAQSADSPLYSLNPEEDEQLFPPESEDHLVDDFLRKKCLRCHLQAPAPHRPGEYRATGCAACHMIYANDGLTMTHDRAIQTVQKAEIRKNKNRFRFDFAVNSLNNKRGYPILHKFTVAVPSVQCEHCHHLNGPGNEFEGLFAKAARPKVSLQKVDGDRPVLYGTQHEFLLPDIHRERGMHCIDCHGASEIKAGGASNPTLHDALEIQCEDCHGTHTQPPDGFLLIESLEETKGLLKSIRLNPNLANKIKLGDVILVNSKGTKMPHVKKEKEQWVLISKVTGKKHNIPLLKNLPVPSAHQVSRHMQSVECSACHARWSASEWGRHVILAEEPDPSLWRDWNFSDPTLQHILFSSPLKEQIFDFKSVSMLDWLTAESSKQGIQGIWEKGVWWDLFAETDWNSLVLGKNSRGKYSVMKPQNQYFITHRTGEGPPVKRAEVPITMDGTPGLMMVPHSPHTIRKSARPCEDCHGNRMAAGLGDPKLANIADAQQFLLDLKSTNRIPPQFQIKQMLAEDGEPIQTALPKENVRFLNPQEVTNLSQSSDQYRAHRYLDLRERGFPRLLTREEYPFDLKHQENEKLFAVPLPDEDFYYDLDLNEFFNSGHEFEIPAGPPGQTIQNPESDVSEDESTQNELTDEEEGIIEFSRDQNE